jgi:DNA-binding NarL/FixJ family response regulator
MFSFIDAQESESNTDTFSRLTVLIADDHALVREGMKLSLERIEPDIRVLEAETLESAVETYRNYPDIDLVLLDLSMPGAQGSTALDRFSQDCPEARIVVVSATYDIATVQSALRKGILGFIPKLAGMSSFINALRFVLDGGIYIPPEAVLPAVGLPPVHAVTAVEKVVPLPTRAPVVAPVGAGPRGARLTTRQIDVLAHLLDGKPNKQICRELNLAMGTVKCHVGAILGALEVNSRAEAIAAADKRGWREWLAEPAVAIRQAA